MPHGLILNCISSHCSAIVFLAKFVDHQRNLASQLKTTLRRERCPRPGCLGFVIYGYFTFIKKEAEAKRAAWQAFACATCCQYVGGAARGTSPNTGFWSKDTVFLKAVLQGA